jgi:hypothetical protein
VPPRRPTARRAPAPALMQEIEPRILFAADLAALAWPSPSGLEPAHEPAHVLVLEAAEAQDRTPDLAALLLQSIPVDSRPAVVLDDLAVRDLAVAADTREAAVPKVELVVIDPLAPDGQRLADDLLAQGAAQGRQFEVVFLDPQRDGMAQIGALLAGRRDVAALHIVSHGSAGALQLGTTRVDSATLQARTEELAQWAQALDPQADILLYGCSVAAGSAGADFVGRLAALTGADVAASTNLTGHASAGGDWQLEHVVGQVDTPVAFSAVLVQDWRHVIATLTVTNSSDVVDGDTSSVAALLGNSGADGISLREALLAANASAGGDVIEFAIAGSGVQTIHLQSALPVITDALLINGFAQPGAGANTNPFGQPDNAVHLIELDGSAAGGAAHGVVIQADGVSVRGLVINGFAGGSAIVVGGTSSGTVIAGNWIGSSASGNTAAGNLRGISLEGSSSGTTVGGSAAAERNLVVASTQQGLRSTTSGAGNLVMGNQIGLGADGSTTLGNGSGIVVTGTGAVAILGNAIHASNGLGIDLGGDGVTANDAGDADAGANALQNFPVLSAATVQGGSVVVGGTLHGAAGSHFRVEFFASAAADGSGHGEGTRYLGFVNVSTSAAGNAAIAATLAATVAAGETVTATATTADATFTSFGATSEFGPNVTAVADTAPTVAAATATTGGGLALNLTGNDAYLVAADGGAVFGGRTAFTLEVQVAITTPAAGDNRLLSYAVNGVSDNEVALAVTPAGRIQLSVGGIDLYSSNTYAQLLDGQVHQISVSWNSTFGSGTFYVDGAPVEGYFGLGNGYTLATGGTLVLGQDQDVELGGFSAGQVLSGTLHDVRVFDHVRAAADVAAQAQATVPYDTTGLVANWQFDQLSPDGVVVDVVEGNNLSTAHAAGFGFSAGTTALTLAVDEHVAAGTVVGTLGGQDAQREQHIASLLAGDATLRYSAETGQFYRVVSTADTWAGAEAAARSGSGTSLLEGVTGQLVVIRSATENAVVLDLIQDYSTDVWLAGSDQAVDDEWRWYEGGVAADTFWTGGVSGSANGVYANWHASEPNNFTGAEVFAAMYYGFSPGAWNDVEGIYTRGHVVEWNADDVLDVAHALSYTIVSQTVAGAFAIDSDSGVLTVAGSSLVDYEAHASHSLTVRTTDPNGLSVDTVFTIALNNVAEAPAITSDGGGAMAALNVAENGTAVTTVSATVDATGTAAYTIVGGADAARFSIDAATGVLVFNTAPDREAPADADADNVYHVTVQVSDGNGGTDAQAIVATVTNVNEAPIITSNGGGAAAAVSVAENSTAVTTVASSDVDGGAAVYAIAGGADAARFSIDAATGALVFSTAPDHEAPVDADGDNVYHVTVQVSDGLGGTDTQAIAVTVTNLNEAPAIASNGGGATAAVSVAEGATAVTTVTSADVDGGAPAYSIVGGADAARFSIDAATGVLVFNIAPDREAPLDADADNVYHVSVQVSDGNGGTATQAIAVTVTNVNEAPVITSHGGGATAAVSVAENGTAVTTVASSDVDGDAPVYSIVGGADAARFAIDATTGALVFSTAPDHEAPADADGDNVYHVTVQAGDGNGGTATQAMTITVTAVNDNAPVITSHGGGAAAGVSVAEGSTAVTTVTAGDADLPAPALVYSIVGGADAALFTIDAATGALVFAAAPDFEAPADADGDNVYQVTVQAGDGSLADTLALSVTVTGVNDRTPVIASDGGGAAAALAVAENGTAVTTVAATDADLPGRPLTYSITGGADAARFVIDSATGVLVFAAAPDFEAPADADGDNVYQVTVSAGDGSLSASQALSVSVTGVNEHAPVITSNGGAATAAISVAENTLAVAQVTATDADLPGQAPAYSIVAGADAARFSIDGLTGVLSFAALPDREAPADADGDNVYQVTVQAGDGVLATTQSLLVTVADVNDNAPVVAPGQQLVLAEASVNGSVVGTVQAVDADGGNALAGWLISGGNVGGAFAIDPATGRITVADASRVDYEATPRFTLQISVMDGTHTSAVQTVTILLTDVAEPVPPVPGPMPSPAPAPVPAPAPAPAPAPVAAPAAQAPAAAPAPRAAAPVVQDLPVSRAAAEPPAADGRRAEAAQSQATSGAARREAAVAAPRTVALEIDLAGLDEEGTGEDNLLWLADAGALGPREALPEGARSQPADDATDPTLWAAKATAVLLGAGLAWWMLRGSGLLASLAAATPLWRHLDPIPILGGDDGSSQWAPDTETPLPRDDEAARDEAAARELLDEARRQSLTVISETVMQETVIS